MSLLDYGKVGKDTSCFGVINDYIKYLKHYVVDRKDFLARVACCVRFYLVMTDEEGVS